MVLCTSDRLVVRHMCASDIDGLFGLLSNPAVMQYLEPPYTYDDTRKFLQKAGLSKPPLIYAVEDNNSNFIGYVIYHGYDTNGVEIGWVLKPDEWHKGYAGELTRLLLDIARQTAQYAVIECVPEQTATKQIALNNGFSYQGQSDGCDIYLCNLHPHVK